MLGRLYVASADEVARPPVVRIGSARPEQRSDAHCRASHLIAEATYGLTMMSSAKPHYEAIKAFSLRI